MPDPIAITVSCHAGFRGDERPVRFSIGANELVVDEVLDRWIGPDHRYFKVRASDGNSYILRHDEGRDAWELEFFLRGDGAEGEK